MDQILLLPSADLLPQLMGSMGLHKKMIEERLPIQLLQDPQGLRIHGDSAFEVERGVHLLSRMLQLLEQGIEMTDQLVSYLAERERVGDRKTIEAYAPDCVCVSAKGKPILPKTLGQSQYIEQMKQHTVTFCTGPAGTGKTYLAVALAVQAFRNHEVDRLILTRPAVEAGEKLGFLPGDLQMKVDPYMRPLYDALHELMGPDTYQKNLEKGLIEVSPLAYMRGRTLDHAFIILDEAQNTTPEQMKMFLTRIGFGSRVVVTGDPTQVDLSGDKPSGLLDAKRVLKGIEDLAFVSLQAEDVVRNRMVQAIIQAYDRADRKRVSEKSHSVSRKEQSVHLDRFSQERRMPKDRKR